jgi:hypothetical protein
MPRCLLFALLALAISSLSTPRALCDPADDGPPISITSPDTGTTFAFGDIKSRALYWRDSDKTLIARVTFTDAGYLDNNAATDDVLEFRLPGVALDAAKGIFYATSAKGEQIPVAHYKKVLFVKTIQVLPNARVRVIHIKGTPVTLILEAISPNDPAMQPAPSDPDATKSVSVQQLFK